LVNKKKVLSLHRYPENNLFTLKKLIPIEDMKRSAVKPIALFFCPFPSSFFPVQRVFQLEGSG